jgi:hypothetical protein
VTIEQLAAIQQDAVRAGDLHCLLCYDPRLEIVSAFCPAEEHRPEYGMRRGSAIAFGLCAECCFTPQEDVLRVLGLRLVPVQYRN